MNNDDGLRQKKPESRNGFDDATDDGKKQDGITYKFRCGFLLFFDVIPKCLPPENEKYSAYQQSKCEFSVDVVNCGVYKPIPNHSCIGVF